MAPPEPHLAVPRTRRCAPATSHRVAGPCPPLVPRGGQTRRVVGLHSRAPARCKSEGKRWRGGFPTERQEAARAGTCFLPGSFGRRGSSQSGFGSGGLRLAGSPAPCLACFSPVRGGGGDARGWGLRRSRQRRWQKRQRWWQTMEE